MTKNFFLISLTSLMLLVVNSAIAQDEQAGVVLTVSGEVSAKGSEAGKRNLVRGDNFYASDIVSTGSGATVALRFLDGSIIDLMGLTDYKITEYTYSEENPAEDSFSSELLKGGFRGISGKIGERNPDKVKVNAQMTTLTIRGTSWEQVMGSCDVMQLIAQQAKVCNNLLFQINQGSVTVTNNVNDESVTLNAQDQLRGLVVTNDSMRQVDSISDGMINDLVGSENNFKPGATLDGESAGGTGSDPCGALQSISP